VISAGIDLAAQPERTAVATINWTAGHAVIEDLVCRADDEDLLQMVKRVSKTGIDCPFGWPAEFVSFVTSHHASHLIPASRPSSRRDLTMRRTDLFVHERLRLTPLSVAADRIAHVAFRCAVLLAKLEEAAGEPVDRAGSGPVAEVYPAASLRSWGLNHRGYKDRGKAEALGRLVDQLQQKAPWLECAAHEEAMRRSHDAFDAVIAAMTARAAALGHILPAAGEDLAAAAAEGWIVIPDRQMRALL
jgi:predicted nuclease with RNAse H fold